MFCEVKKDETFPKTEVTLFSNSEAFKKAVRGNEAYIAGETQAIDLAWAASTGLEKNEADGKKVSFTTIKK